MSWVHVQRSVVKRRLFLAAAAGTAGSVGAAGRLHSLELGAAGGRDGGGPSGSGAPRDDSRDPGPGARDWPGGTDFVETTSVGDRDAVTFPDANRPHVVALWNRAGRERTVSVTVHSDGAVERGAVGPFSIPAWRLLAVELNVPAEYALELSVGGEPFGSVVLDRRQFDCNHSSSRYALGASDIVDYGDVSTTMGCASPTVAGTELSTEPPGCADAADDRAVVTYEGETVTVDGRFVSRSPARALSLAVESYDDRSGRLRVVVEAATRDVDEPRDCDGVIEYDATLAFEADLPDVVAVVHRAIDGAERMVGRGERNGSL